jgi:hypothetical protein
MIVRKQKNRSERIHLGTRERAGSLMRPARRTKENETTLKQLMLSALRSVSFDDENVLVYVCCEMN